MDELGLGSRGETLSCALPILPRTASEKGSLSSRPQLAGLHISQEQFFRLLPLNDTGLGWGGGRLGELNTSWIHFDSVCRVGSVCMEY